MMARLIRALTAPLWPWAGNPHQTARHLRLLHQRLAEARLR